MRSFKKWEEPNLKFVDRYTLLKPSLHAARFLARIRDRQIHEIRRDHGARAHVARVNADRSGLRLRERLGTNDSRDSRIYRSLNAIVNLCNLWIAFVQYRSTN